MIPTIQRVGAAALLLAASISAGAVTKAAPTAQAASIIGRVEYVVMQDVAIKLKARIDTGAGVSSIDAKILQIKPAAGGNGERVVFEIRDDAGNAKSVERKIVEWAEIKGKGTKKSSRRPVVILDFCLGGKRLEGRINLADRSGFIYPVLIGRNILKTGDFLIDPSKTFMRQPGCTS